MEVVATTYQAISGAGKTFQDWPEMVGNVIPSHLVDIHDHQLLHGFRHGGIHLPSALHGLLIGPARGAGEGQAGRLVLYCVDKGSSIDRLSLEELQRISDKFEADIYDAISLFYQVIPVGHGVHAVQCGPGESQQGGRVIPVQRICSPEEESRHRGAGAGQDRAGLRGADVPADHHEGHPPGL